MPCYTIDTDDGRSIVRGDEEVSFSCPHKAKVEADRVLGDMTEDVLPDGDERVLRAIVRDESGRKVYEATVTFVGRWKVQLVA